MELMDKAAAALIDLRSQRPLIHHITNFVTMTDCANATLAIGASPTMTDAVEEVAEMASAASALVLNMGTLQQSRFDAMLLAGKTAAEKGIPIVLDPVGAGGTSFRTSKAMALLKSLPVTVIRGNLSEITALAAHTSGVNPGVDSHAKEAITVPLAKKLALLLGTTIVITGPIDAVSDGKRTAISENGASLLTYVTGTGCMTTSLIASYAAVADPFVAAVAGVMTMGIAGEIAAEQGSAFGPGTFHSLLMDAIYNVSPEILKMNGKVLTYDE